jgi:hypothetical protein
MAAGRSSSTAQQSGVEKRVKVVVGGNSTGEGGRPTSQVSCKETCRPEKVGAVSPIPACFERGKLAAEACTQENSE